MNENKLSLVEELEHYYKLATTGLGFPYSAMAILGSDGLEQAVIRDIDSVVSKYRKVECINLADVLQNDPKKDCLLYVRSHPERRTRCFVFYGFGEDPIPYRSFNMRRELAYNDTWTITVLSTLAWGLMAKTAPDWFQESHCLRLEKYPPSSIHSRS